MYCVLYLSKIRQWSQWYRFNWNRTKEWTVTSRRWFKWNVFVLWCCHLQTGHVLSASLWQNFRWFSPCLQGLMFHFIASSIIMTKKPFLLFIFPIYWESLSVDYPMLWSRKLKVLIGYSQHISLFNSKRNINEQERKTNAGQINDKRAKFLSLGENN